MIRLMIASGHQILRESLANLLVLVDDIRVVAVVTSAAESLATLNRMPVDLVLWDMSVDDLRSRRSFLAELRRNAHHVPILVLATYTYDIIRHWALGQGAAAFLGKDEDAELLIATIRRLVPAGGDIVATGAVKSRSAE